MFGGGGGGTLFWGEGGGEIPPPHAVAPTPAETNRLKHSLFPYFSNVLNCHTAYSCACMWM